MALRLTRVREGAAELLVPKESFRDPFAAGVFYNPAMSFGRTISSLAMGCAAEVLGTGRASVLDGLCSLGARGIRYALENKNVGRVLFVDANNNAVKVLKRNIALNKLKRKSAVWSGDLNKFLASAREKFEVIEIDPFGTPAPFLENAARKLEGKAILSVTATDLAALCGAQPKPCLRHYAAKPMKCEYSHELALRILLGAMACSAARYERGIKPLVSWYQRHYVKTIALVEEGAAKADEALKNLGFVSHCFKCFHRVAVNVAAKLPLEKCPACGSGMDYAGPLWTAELCEERFLKKMAEENIARKYDEKAEAAHLLSLLEKENSLPPTFFDLHALARMTKKVPPLQKAVEAIRRKGFEAEATHFSPKALKTNADAKEVVRAVAETRR